MERRLGATFLQFFDSFCRKMRVFEEQEKTAENNETPANAGVSGGGDSWNRTSDTRIFSPLLYQLSYVTVDLRAAKVNIFSLFQKELHFFIALLSCRLS